MQSTKMLYDLSFCLSAIKEQLEGYGIGIETSEDFEEFQSVCAGADRRHSISEPFSPEYFDILPKEGVWMRGYDHNGKTIHTSALRINDLGDVTLAEYWLKQLKRLHGGQPAKTSCPGAKKITGKVVYQGDVWLHKDHRGNDLGGLFFKLGLVTALLKWDPDYVYGFVAEKLIFKGFAARGGYVHCEPAGSHWSQTPNVDPKDWLVWMGKDDVHYLAEQPMTVTTAKSRPIESHLESELA
ncbi:hypothetical protein [Kiloniella majae]|uniref:hypothetical protein n=1 Tax=Kiloniella majae TaxID=1938558 RepID=UPI000A27959F|nr:hypothetical protein [Kiloniella majae]